MKNEVADYSFILNFTSLKLRIVILIKEVISNYKVGGIKLLKINY